MSTNSFVHALRGALVGKSRLEVANAAGVTTGAIGNWLSGNITSPDPQKVFAVERALGARPGHLSRHLGYVPNEALEPTQPVGFGQWMDEHANRLTGRQRELLTGIYDEFVGSLPPMSAEFRAEVTAEDRAAEERALRAGLSPRPPRRPDEGHQRPA